MSVRARSPQSRRLAVAALAASALTVVAIVLLQGAGSYTIRAVFAQVYGLVPGAEVQAAGLNVGSVQSISLTPAGLPVVTMRIDGSYPLRAGATASVEAFSVTGEYNRYVALTSGTGPRLADGATITEQHTTTPVEIYQVLDTLTPRTRATVRGLLAGLDASLRGQGPNLDAALAHSAQAIGNTAALLAEVNADGRQLRNFVTYGSSLVATLASDPGNLGHVVDTLEPVLATTAARQGQLTAIADELSPGLRAPSRALAVLDSSIGSLRTLVREATPGVAALVPFSRRLAPTLTAAPAAVRSANALVTSAPADVRALNPLVGRLRAVLPVLRSDTRSVNPILDQLRVRLPDVFSFFANWADFTADYDANGHAARVGLVFTPAPNNVIGPCSSGAGSLSVPFLRAPGAAGGQPWRNFASSFIGGSQAQPGGC